MGDIRVRCLRILDMQGFGHIVGKRYARLTVEVEVPPDMPDPPNTGVQKAVWVERLFDHVSDRSGFFSLAVTSYSLTGSVFKRLTPTESLIGPSLQEFTAHELAVKLPDGTSAVVLLPNEYAAAVNVALKAQPPVEEERSRWDRLLEDDSV